MTPVDLADLGRPATQTLVGRAEADGVGVLDDGETSGRTRPMPPASRSGCGVRRESDLAEMPDQVCKVCEVFWMPMVGDSPMGDLGGGQVCGGLRGLRRIGGGLP